MCCVCCVLLCVCTGQLSGFRLWPHNRWHPHVGEMAGNAGAAGAEDPPFFPGAHTSGRCPGWVGREQGSRVVQQNLGDQKGGLKRALQNAPGAICFSIPCIGYITFTKVLSYNFGEGIVQLCPPAGRKCEFLFYAWNFSCLTPNAPSIVFDDSVYTSQTAHTKPLAVFSVVTLHVFVFFCALFLECHV